MNTNKTSIDMWDEQRFSYMDIQRLLRLAIDQFNKEGKSGYAEYAEYASVVLTNARAMLNDKISENLNKHRIDRVLAIMTEVIDSPSAIGVDYDKIDASKAEKLVRRLNAALE